MKNEKNSDAGFSPAILVSFGFFDRVFRFFNEVHCVRCRYENA